MWTFLLRRLVALPPLLAVISFLTYLLLQAAPGDYFTTLESDPKRSKDFIMNLRASAGKVTEVPPAGRAAGPGTFRVGPTEYGFDASGALLRDGKPADPKAEQQAVKKFSAPDGETYTVTPEGRVYRWVGPVAGYFAWLRRLWPLHACGDASLHETQAEREGADVGGTHLRWDGVNLGVSYQGQAKVTELIVDRVANTLILGGSSLLLAWFIAVPLGVWSGVRPNSPVDHACGFFANVSLSVPTVFLSVLGLLLAYGTKWFPVGDMHDVHHEEMGWWDQWKDTCHHLVLPAVTIALAEIAIFMRQMRSQMVETMSADFVRTARAKGVSHNRVVFVHALRNAINPLVTLFGFSIAAILSGEFLVEVIYNWPGLAQVTVSAIFQRDEPLVMASVLMAALLLVAGNLLADVLLVIVDPRIRLD
jgi:peptide/nickel transport system permease protein